MKRHIHCSLFATAISCQAQPAADLQNWFSDPFFQASAYIKNCPVPAGPFVSEADKRVQAHRRAEKGTTCWLAKECDRPNAYAYDNDISSALRAAAQQKKELFQNTTLWFTIQGRIVYIEGCAQSKSVSEEAEAFARAIPNVQQAIAIIRSDPTKPVPYKLRFAQ